MAIKAVAEVKSYMLDYQRSMMNFEEDNNRFWWIGSRIFVKRESERCESLVLTTGELCKDRKNGRFCSYHALQHDIICNKYHATCRVDLKNVSDGTKSFIEFVLRKEFDFIYGFAVRHQPYEGHRERYGYLFDNMFDPPYPAAMRGIIDPEFYRDAEIVSRVIDRRKNID